MQLRKNKEGQDAGKNYFKGSTEKTGFVCE